MTTWQLMSAADRERTVRVRTLSRSAASEKCVDRTRGYEIFSSSCPPAAPEVFRQPERRRGGGHENNHPRDMGRGDERHPELEYLGGDAHLRHADRRRGEDHRRD